MSQATLNAQLLALPSLAALTLNDIQLGLKDLLSSRSEAALQARAGQLYIPILTPILDSINALPPHVIKGDTLVDALASADDTHDGFGAALWFFAEGCKRLPSLDPNTLATILKAQQTFIPQRRDLNRAYADEAAAAHQHRLTFPSQQAALDAIPTPDGHTFAHLVDRFIRAGEQIEDLLKQRAIGGEGTSRGVAPALRMRALDTLSSYRAALIDEIRAGLTPLSTLDATFSYLHLLANQRAKSSTPTPTPTPTSPA